MTDWVARAHVFLVRHRRAVLLGFLLICGGALWGVSRLRLSEDFTDMLPLSEPAIAEQFEALRSFRQADRLFVDVSANSPETLAEAADAMAGALENIPGLEDIRHRLDAGGFQAEWERWQKQLPELLDASDLDALRARLQPAAIEKRLAWFRQALSQPQGLLLKDAVLRDPVGLGDALAERLQALRAGLGGVRTTGGRLTSPDGRHALISAVPQFPASNRPRSARLITEVLSAARTVEQRYADAAVKVAVTGAHRVALDNATLILRDAALTAAVAALGVFLLIWWVYRRLRIALLTLAPPLFGGLAATAVLGLTGEWVSAIALGCGSILIGITDDYGNHVLYRADDGAPGDRPSLPALLARLALPLAFSALVTMAAFLVLLLSPVPGHRQLGWFAASGVLFAALFAIVILPLLMPAQPRVEARPLPLTPVVDRALRWCDRRRRALAALLALVSVACATGAMRLRFEGDITRLNGLTAATRRDERTVQATWGQVLGQTVLAVSAPSIEEALEKNERVREILERFEARQTITSFSSVASLLPSARSRQTNLQAWRAWWTEDRRMELSNTLGRAAAPLGFRADSFHPFLESLAMSEPRDKPTLRAADLRGSVLAPYVQADARRVSICSLAKVPDARAFQTLRDAVRREVPGAALLNKAVLTEDISRLARKGLLAFALLVLGLNALLLRLLLGRMVLVGVTLLPILASILWTLGTLGWLGLPINIANCIFVIFVVGVGIDYSLHLVAAKLERWRGYPDQLATTGGSVTVCALTTLLGIGALILARHPALYSVGLTALLGMTFSLAATLLLVPWCMDALLRRADVAVRQPAAEPSLRRRQVRRLYRYQGVYVEQFAFWKLRLDPLFEALEGAVPARGMILDLGCGYGLVDHWLAFGSADRTFLGVDRDADKIRVAQATARRNPALSFEQRDLLAWDFPACDCVLLCDVLHYFPRELKAQVLGKAFQALRAGGSLVLRDACAEASGGHRAVVWAERWAVALRLNKSQHGLFFESQDGHRGLLQEVGFVRIEVRHDGGLASNRLILAKKA